MLKKYPELRNALVSSFSTSLAQTDLKMEETFERCVLENPLQLELIRKELRKFFVDSNVDWVQFLINDEDEIYITDPTPYEACKFIVENVWNKVFPDETPPRPNPYSDPDLNPIRGQNRLPAGHYYDINRQKVVRRGK